GGAVSRLSDVADLLESRLPGRVQRSVPSGSFTTYRVGGPLAVVALIGDDAALDALAGVVRRVDVPVLVVGRGSNLLVADGGFDGVAVVLGDQFERIVVDAENASVLAGGSASLPVLARRAAAAGVSGLEFYVGIPGSVGGAVRMNAGGHGRETRDVLVDVDLFELRDGTRSTRAGTSFEFAYRHSNLGDHTVVCAARFSGSSDSPEACGERIDAIVRWRREHQPGGANAGSVFSNPPGDSAGRLIEATGLKGLRVGGAVVSEKHGNFVVADRSATASDVCGLIDEVRRRVADATGTVLETEVRLVGFAETRPIDSRGRR
ncbi:MAG: UDP-N-acetylmuramate dehydrogenase, partial [Actinomycetota bacterium]|nr:UDP-N-acetylmuramate dehydrogenase [Actinomycetota bacterium]